MRAVHRFIAVLLLVGSVSKLLKLAKAIFDAMTGNPRFPNPRPALAAIMTAIQELFAAEAACKTRAKGTVEVRDEKRSLLVALLEQARQYVQEVADANPADAKAIIEGAGMRVKRSSAHSKPDFEAKQGKSSGEVILIARRTVRRSFYEWEWSTDQKAWVSAPSTMQAKTTLRGLIAGTTYYFRFRSVGKSGEGDWSNVVSLLVK